MSATVLAHKQTGPRTIPGKERSSNNATLHGGTSKRLIVAGESQADFDALLNGLVDEYRPDTLQSRLFVEEVAIAQWFLFRRLRAFNAIEAAVYEDEPDESAWGAEHFKRLALADRYKTQAERALKRALANLDAWRKEKRGEEERQVRSVQWDAAHAIRVRRLELAEGKAFRFARPDHSHQRSDSSAASSEKSLGQQPL